MKRTASKVFIIMTITMFSLLAAVFSIIPIIGPSLSAYVMGLNESRNERLYGITMVHNLTAITIGELIFYIIVSLIIRTLINFDDANNFWHIMIGAFTLNYIISLIFYLSGRLKSQKKSIKNDN